MHGFGGIRLKTAGNGPPYASFVIARASARNIGAIEAGRRADIVVIDTNGPLFIGREDDELMDTLIFAGAGHEVRDVMVAGRWLVQEGRHFAETAIAAGYKRAMQRILRNI